MGVLRAKRKLIRVEYKKEKAVWGDRYFVEIFETQKNIPGFAPEEYEVKVCEILMKYSNWSRRIEFEEVIISLSTLKKIYKIVTGKFEKSKYKEVKED